MSEDKINVKEIITFFGMLIIGWILLFYSSQLRGLSKFTDGGNLALLLMVLGIIFIIIGLMYLMVLSTKKGRRFIKERKKMS